MPDPRLNTLIHSEDGWSFLLADIVAIKINIDDPVAVVSLSNAQIAKVRMDSRLVDLWRAARAAVLAPAPAKLGLFS